MTMRCARAFRCVFETTFLTEKCKILRRVANTGVLSTSEQSYEVLASDVKCSIEARTQRDSRSPDNHTVRVGNEYLLKVSFSQEVIESDIFRLVNAEGVESDYSIKPVFEHKIESGVLKKIVVEKLSYNVEVN